MIVFVRYWELVATKTADDVLHDILIGSTLAHHSSSSNITYSINSIKGVIYVSLGSRLYYHT
jgi:hypothetical protein